VDAPTVFDAVASRFSTYMAEWCPPGSTGAAGAIETASLLRELSFLDRSIIKGFEDASKDRVLFMQSVIQEAIRKDPNSEFARKIGPEQRMVQFATGYNSLESYGPETQQLLLRLQTDTDAFYNKAHRLLKIVRELPQLGKVECKEIMIVRNQLIEHAGQGTSNREHWSFGFATRVGPQVRPLVVGSQIPSHSDKGYLPNRDGLAAALRGALDAALRDDPR
jgi:hypothetical protein